MIASNYAEIRAGIQSAAAGRAVKLIGVTKTVSSERIAEAYRTGLRCFGENRVQEALPKITTLPADIEWHFIGHLQSNKAREAVRNFSWIHSVDSVRLMSLIEKEAAKIQKKMNLLLEVNSGGEETKHGMEPDAVSEAVTASLKLEWCRVLGLMTVPPFYEDAEKVRPYFRMLREIAAPFTVLKELSMGMSHDYMVAIEEGSTIVRIGTALFGLR